MSSALVSNIQGYSIHDGPGIRTTVFLQGCHLRCRWCANPENLEAGPAIGFLSRLCRGCGECARACTRGAIRFERGSRIDRARCDRCGDCVTACDTGALVLYGKRMEAEEVFREVRKDKMFYTSSGGGVTVSGGEPLLWPDFLRELFTLCRGEGIHTCVETCAAVSWEAFEMILPVMDLVYCDLKLMDPVRHREQTGTDNRLTLENAKKLAECGVEVRFRKPLIPGVNDDSGDIRDSAGFLRALGVPKLELMPYHRAGKSKYEALDLLYATGELPPLAPAEAERIKEEYSKLGIDCTVSR